MGYVGHLDRVQMGYDVESASKKEIEYHIGIDPGVQTGIAIWIHSRQRFLELKTSSFWPTYKLVIKYKRKHKDKLLVTIEDPGLIPPIFPRRGMSKMQMQKIAQNVGMNKAHAALMIQGLMKAGVQVQTVKPITKKWTDAMFRMITGVDKRVSQHVRDAAKLVVGL